MKQLLSILFGFLLSSGVFAQSTLTVDKVTGAILGPVPAATFKTANAISATPLNGTQLYDSTPLLFLNASERRIYGPDGSTVWADFSNVTALGFPDFSSGLSLLGGTITFGSGDGTLAYINESGDLFALTLNGSGNAITFGGNVYNTANFGTGLNLAGNTSLKQVKGTSTNDNAAAGYVREYVSASVVQASAVTLVTATPKTVTSISLTAGDWDVTGVGSLTAASTGTEFDVAVGTTTNSFTGTVLGDTRCQTPTVSLTGADASLMIPAVRMSLATTTTIYLIVQETFTVGSPKAYGRISARRE